MARKKYICDKIMHHIMHSENKGKFGLSGVIALFDGKATDIEVADAVAWLIENSHIRMLGQYVFGIGSGDDLAIYDLSGFKLFDPIPAADEKPNTQGVTDAYKGESNAPKRPPVEGQLTKQVQQASVQLNDAPLVPESTPVFTLTTEPAVFAAIERLQHQLQPKNFADIELKIEVLTRLIPFDPVIGSVLDSIRSDYQSMVQPS